MRVGSGNTTETLSAITAAAADDADPAADNSESDDSDTSSDIGDDVDKYGIPVRWRDGHGDTRVNWSTVVDPLDRQGDTGHCGAHPVSAANASVPAKKRSPLLSDGFGITGLNRGMLAMLGDFLSMAETVITRLQHRGQPIQHKAFRWLAPYTKKLLRHWVGDTNGNNKGFGELYRDLREQTSTAGVDGPNGGTLPSEPALIEVEALAERLARAMSKTFKARLEDPG